MALKGRNLISNLFHSNRSSLTCTYKCGNACFGECGNKSSNEYFGDMSRRTALKAGGLSVLSFGGASIFAAQTANAQSSSSSFPGSSTGSANNSSSKHSGSVDGMKFKSVEPNTKDTVTVPAGYQTNVLIAWGDPVVQGAPEFDINNQTAAKQEQQFGFNNDFAGLIEHPSDAGRLVYMCSHEYTTEPQMHPNYDSNNPTEEQVNIGLAAHGHTILEVSTDARTGKLKREFGPLNRRITAQTPFKLVGPAAGTDLLKTNADSTGETVLGTLNNCAGGVTPWGTMLSGEENIDQYFTNADALTGRNKEYADRIGVDGSGQSQRGWELFHDRFDLEKEPNEINRFGYIVEIDPTDPTSTPIKHTSMGRFKHEAGNVHVTADGTVVCYSGDDERFEYIYKFISSEKIVDGDMAHNMQILDYGTLYVASLEGNSPQDEIDGAGTLPEDGAFDGTGIWHPLLTVTREGTESHIDGFTAEEVAVYTRLAADTVGATKMDRPEDFQANPVDGKVYVALTNNSYRGATGTNASKNEEDPREWAPIKENKNGLVMEIDDVHAGTTFGWNIFLICGDPDQAYSYFAGYDKSKVSPISCPDNLAFDSYGNLWISTDGNALDTHDGLYAVTTTGPNRGELKCFLTVPTDAETCGPIVDDRRVMVNVQHPGEGDESTVENPSSHWPDGGNSKPRPAVAVAWKANGGNIGM
ncbi:PhoX family protein [Corynebacterium lubricantis]|uniref:PhoX family protein n=1 Tax=Corynebacterium lubricantis TaxID=541095 RepID=UPI00036B2589|nr:PhoX family phosphatase [Corynebacterium lubricantis]